MSAVDLGDVQDGSSFSPGPSFTDFSSDGSLAISLECNFFYSENCNNLGIPPWFFMYGKSPNIFELSHD